MNFIHARKYRISLLIAGFVSLARPISTGQAASSDLSSNEYAVFASVPLREELDGTSGRLQILEDARLTPGMRRVMWGAGHDPMLAFQELGIGNNDPLYKSFKQSPILPAVVRLVDSSGVVVGEEKLGSSLADTDRFVDRMLYVRPHYRPVTIDDSIGMGAYRGLVTRFISVAGGKISWAQSIDDASGQQKEIVLTSSLKNNWKIVTLRPNNIIKQYILSVSCHHSDSINEKTNDDFMTTYIRYTWHDGSWHTRPKSEPGCWEQEKKDDFPSESLFPNPD